MKVLLFLLFGCEYCIRTYFTFSSGQAPDILSRAKRRCYRLELERADLGETKVAHVTWRKFKSTLSFLAGVVSNPANKFSMCADIQKVRNEEFVHVSYHQSGI